MRQPTRPVIPALLTLTLLVAACGGTKKAATAAGGATSQGAGAAVNASVQGAIDFVAKNAAQSTPIVVDKPVSRAPKPGVHVVFLQCGAPVCKQFGDAIQLATDRISWKLDRIDAGLTPETFVAAYDQAVAARPDA